MKNSVTPVGVEHRTMVTVVAEDPISYLCAYDSLAAYVSAFDLLTMNCLVWVAFHFDVMKFNRLGLTVQLGDRQHHIHSTVACWILRIH